MIVGIPREVKDHEHRVGLTPGGVDVLVRGGHQVLVERDAGKDAGFPDAQYTAVGARIAPDHVGVYGAADLVIKVKEPVPSEFPLLDHHLTLFCYLHLAADRELTEALVSRRVNAIAFETVQLPDRSLPLLAPMSEVAGRMSVQVAAQYLEKVWGGRGKLLSGVPGVAPARVVILGGGTVGTSAARVALGMGAHVTILDLNIDRLRYLSEVLHGHLTTLASNPLNIAGSLEGADAVIGAVLIPGARAPKLVDSAMIASMGAGAVAIDVAVDQGGCIATCHPTTHSNPTYVVHGVTHYCVTNMPGAVPNTATQALTNAILPFARKLADQGFVQATLGDPALAAGVNTCEGHVVHPGVAEAFGLPRRSLEAALGAGEAPSPALTRAGAA
jgi:alanine dehydrogenase